MYYLLGLSSPPLLEGSPPPRPCSAKYSQIQKSRKTQKIIPSHLEEINLALDKNIPLDMESFKKMDNDQFSFPPIAHEIKTIEDQQNSDQQIEQITQSTIIIFVNLHKNDTQKVFSITLQDDDSIEDLKVILIQRNIIEANENILINQDGKLFYGPFKNNAIYDIYVSTDEFYIVEIEMQLGQRETIKFQIGLEKSVPFSRLWERLYKNLPEEYQNYRYNDKCEISQNSLHNPKQYNLSQTLNDLNWEPTYHLHIRCGLYGGCFPAFAPITLCDGTYKQISQIEIGDRVLSYNIDHQEFTPSYVVALHQSIVNSITWIRTSEQLIKTTPNHPFLTENGWKAVQPDPQWLKQLTINDKILNNNKKFIDIISIDTKFQEEQIVYNITTTKPHNYLAYNHIVHNVSIVIVKAKEWSCAFEIFPEILIFNIKLLIQLKYKIEIEKQELSSQGLKMENHKPLKFYDVHSNKGYLYIDFTVTDQNLSKDQNPEEIVQLQLIQNNQSFYFKMPRVCSFQELQNTLAMFNYTLPQKETDLSGYDYETLKYKEYYFFCEGQFFDYKTKQMQFLLHDNQQVVQFHKDQQLSSLQLTQYIQNIEIRNLQQLKNSLISIVDQTRLNFLLESVIQEIYQSYNKKPVYQQFQMHHLVAIKIYTSNLVYKQLNIDLRNQQFDKWKQFLRCLLEGYQYCSYYNGLAFRGVRDYQNKQLYQVGKILKWSELSSSSKDLAIAQKFSNQQGTIFELQLISAKDIEELSLFTQEKEVLMPPFSQFTVMEVLQKLNSPILVKLREFPQPRSTKILLWIDDNPQNNYKYTKGLEQELQISIVFCLTTNDAINLINTNKWMVLLNDENLRVVTDMVRIENKKLNLFAGRDFLHHFYNILKCEQETLVFCSDIQKAKENILKQNIIGNYKITKHVKDLEKFIRFL